MLKRVASGRGSFVASSRSPRPGAVLPREPRAPGLSLAGFHHPPLPGALPTPLLLEELLVEEENEQVDVDFGLVEHLHDGYALVLQLQEVLRER